MNKKNHPYEKTQEGIGILLAVPHAPHSELSFEFVFLLFLMLLGLL